MAGLSMSKEQFRSLPSNRKLDILFDNQLETLKLINGYKIYYKFTTVIGSILIVGMGILYKIHLI